MFLSEGAACTPAFNLSSRIKSIHAESVMETSLAIALFSPDPISSNS